MAKGDGATDFLGFIPIPDILSSVTTTLRVFALGIVAFLTIAAIGTASDGFSPDPEQLMLYQFVIIIAAFLLSAYLEVEERSTQSPEEAFFDDLAASLGKDMYNVLEGSLRNGTEQDLKEAFNIFHDLMDSDEYTNTKNERQKKFVKKFEDAVAQQEKRHRPVSTSTTVDSRSSR